MTTARTLPIHVAPVTDGALDSWLEAISHRLRSAHGDTLTSVGLASPGLVGVEESWLTRLPAPSAEHISAVTGQPIERLHQMTLAHYASPRQTITSEAKRPSPWSQTHRSRYCPDCLAESDGRWQLQWRLGWQFLCDTNRATLMAERSANDAPDILRPALDGIGGWERLQRFAKASKYPTLTIAAKELRVHHFALVNQINRIERELGTKLLERAERGRPMRLNADGAAVVQAVRSYERRRARRC